MKKIIVGFGAMIILAAMVASIPDEKVTPESSGENYMEIYITDEPIEVEFIEFEPIEIKVPLIELDFSDEEPTLITPSNTVKLLPGEEND